MIGIKKTTLLIWTSSFGVIAMIRLIFLLAQVRDYLTNHFDY